MAVPPDAELQNAMRLVYGPSDQMHVRVRGFRNVLLVSALLITLLMWASSWSCR